MNRYGVTINNRIERVVKASQARTAVNKAMQAFSESEFKPVATLKVRFIEKVAYHFDIVADVPFDYGGNKKGTSRETVASSYSKNEDASAEALRASSAHPDWRCIRVVKRETL